MLSERISTAEDRLNEAVETGRTRLRAIVGEAEESVEATIPILRENLEIWRERAFEDAERFGGYVTHGLSRASSWLPKIELELPAQIPSPEQLATAYFDNVTRAVALQRKLTFDWLAALRQTKRAAKASAPKTTAQRPARAKQAPKPKTVEAEAANA